MRANTETCVSAGSGAETLSRVGEWPIADGRRNDMQIHIASLHHNRAVYGIRSEIKAAFNICEETFELAPLTIDGLGTS
ncbi:MAG: hypothetical protein QGI45_11090 [Myxococcota bacterium]|nr:hypothetical protein [Myxococcota bacterium]